jgi:hypothetical protein
MTHFVELDVSFKDNLPELTESAQGEIARIISALERDPFFEPGDDYLFQRNSSDQSCVCVRISGSWGNWKIVWCYEYSSVLPSNVEVVVVAMVREAVELKVIKPRSPFQGLLGAPTTDTVYKKPES